MRNRNHFVRRIAGWIWIGVFLVTAPATATGDAGSVTISVVDPGGETVTDARVLLVEARRSIFVDDRGVAEFADVPPGGYHVEVASPRFGAVVLELVLGPGQSYRERVEMTRATHHERIIVTATPGGRGSAELIIPVSVLDEDELNERMQPTLGETLAEEPGIHSTFFGAGSSRPIIRGQGGGRVRILEGGLGVGDASTASPDHAVATDPLTADTIEIVRGPAALLYDTSAIGGLVNILDAPPRSARERSTWTAAPTGSPGTSTAPCVMRTTTTSPGPPSQAIRKAPPARCPTAPSRAGR